MSIFNLKKNFDSIIRWEKFSPGKFIDFNPCQITLENGKSFVFFRREAVPLFNKNSAIYYTQVGSELSSIQEPSLLIENGEDPRVVKIANKIYLFYIVPKKISPSSAIGCEVRLALISESNSALKIISEYILPVNPFPTIKPEGGINGWEKNWVPFINESNKIKVIYSHDPWLTFELEISEEEKSLKIINPDYKYGIKWDFGKIRGGTPPIKYKENFYVSFFHSSCIIGGKKLYLIGAILIDTTNGNTNPIYITKRPLIAAPLREDINHHGWPTSASVLFPLSAQRNEDSFQIMCGINDYDIGYATIRYSEIDEGFSPIKSRPDSTMFDIFNEKSIERNGRPLLNVPSQVGGVAEATVIKLSSLLFGGGKTFIDIGAHIGFYSVFLSQDFDNVFAFEPSKFQKKWLDKNIADNNLDNVTAYGIGISDNVGETDLFVLSSDGGLNTLDPSVASSMINMEKYKCQIRTLDSFKFANVDLIKIDVEGLEGPVLSGAIETINSSRPVILIEVWDESKRRSAINEFMSKNNYTFEFLLETAPELAICFPVEKRDLYSWFF
jgi:FkbM family methyltransferase